MSEWINTSKKFPEKDKLVIFITACGQVRIGYYDGCLLNHMWKDNKNFHPYYINVNYWIAMPEAPK